MRRVALGLGLPVRWFGVLLCVVSLACPSASDPMAPLDEPSAVGGPTGKKAPPAEEIELPTEAPEDREE